MDVAISYGVVSLVTLCATIFIVLLHHKNAQKDIRQLDFKVLAIELLTLTVWVTLFVQVVTAQSTENGFYALFLFLLSVIFGILLIRNILKESQIQKTIHTLMTTLQHTNDRLREIDHQKTEFISLTSHQLRGPLSVIEGHTEMLLDGDFGKVPKNIELQLQKIAAASRNLGTLLNDFLDVARLEKGELTYTVAPFDIIDVLENGVNEFQTICDNHALTLTKTFSPNDEIIVLADKQKVSEIISQVLDNAITYTPGGSITVSVAAKHSDAIITIKDTGIGIDEEDLQEMFQKFKRGKNANEVSVHGSGLGLYVAHQMLEAQGGKIWVESAGKNKGSTFYIALPLRD